MSAVIPPVDDAERRALQKAYHDNCVCAKVSGRWIASSTSGNAPHEVIDDACDCPGYGFRRMCKHLAVVRHARLRHKELWECPNCHSRLVLPADADTLTPHATAECTETPKVAFPRLKDIFK